MLMIIKGINTVSIKQGEHLYVMAFKLRSHNNDEHMLFLQISTLVDFLIILRHRMSKVKLRIEERGEDYTKELIDIAKSMANNIPEIKHEEVMTPDIGNLVTSLAPKFQEESFNIIAMLNSQNIVTLEINDSQVEFIIRAISHAIELAKDQEASRTISSVLDFIMLYSVDFSDINNLQYREVKHSSWKVGLYSNFIQVLYSFDIGEEKKYLPVQ